MSNYEEVAGSENYEMIIELKEGLLFMHCEVFNFSKSVLKEIKHRFKIVLEAAKEMGNTAVFAQTKNERFVKALGVEYDIIAEFNDEEGDRVVGVAWGL